MQKPGTGAMYLSSFLGMQWKVLGSDDNTEEYDVSAENDAEDDDASLRKQTDDFGPNVFVTNWRAEEQYNANTISDGHPP